MSSTSPSSTPDDVLARREQIEQAIAGRTVPAAFLETVAERGDQPAYSDKVGVDAADGTGWRTITWRELHEQALDVAGALVQAGVAPGEKVAIMAASRIEHVAADLGSLLAGLVPISIYNTLAPEQVAFIAGEVGPAVLFHESTDHLERWDQVLAASGSVRAVVSLDADALGSGSSATYTAWDDFLAEGRAWRQEHGALIEERTAATTPDQPVTILFTSGTTGNPKGVVLTHHNMLSEVEASLLQAPMEGENVYISYLPFAHIAERLLGMYVPWTRGGHIHLLADPALLVGALAEVRPTRFFGVPRVWEKIRTGVSAKLAAEPDEEKRAGVQQAMDIGLAWVESRQAGHETPPELQERFEAVDASVLGPLRGLLGLDRCEWAASAAAPMPEEVARFFAGLGIRIYDVYGMTETSAAVTAGGPDDFRLGTVGRALPGVELRIADDGEIVVRSPMSTPGYAGNEAATRALLDEDGWVHTGDIGELDEDGFLRVVDRKKEMIITSSGKNLAPSNIENLLKESPIIGHAMAFGEGHPYVVAVMTLDAEVAPVVAQQAGIEFTDLADLAQRPEIRALAEDAVRSANDRLSRPEQVKAFELLGVEWTAESDELTPTLKLKRRVVNEKYSDVLERLYS